MSDFPFDSRRALRKEISGQCSGGWWTKAGASQQHGKSLLKWPAYKIKDDLLMAVGDNVEVMAIPHKEALDFLDANFERQSKAADP